MTTQNAIANLVSTSSVSEPPYATCDDALARCELAPELPNAQTMSTGWYVDDADVNDGFECRAILDPEWPDILKASGSSNRNDLRLSIQFLKADIRFFHTLESWSATSHPRELSIKVPPGLGTDFDIAIQATLFQKVGKLPNRPYRAASVVASRKFRFSANGYSLDIRFADFEANNWGANALWHVEITDVDIRPRDAVIVHVNETVKNYLVEESNVRESTKKVFEKTVMAGIFSDIALKTLLQGDPEVHNNPNGMFQIVLDQLTGSNRSREPAILELAKTDAHELGRLAQDSMNLASEIVNV